MKNREFFFRMLGVGITIFLGVFFQLSLNSNAPNLLNALGENPWAWLLYFFVGFSISEYIYNYIGRK